LNGLMLLGPPGVGKTTALKAVQQACAEKCLVSDSCWRFVLHTNLFANRRLRLCK
jgi:MoxR-like ATPase